MTLVVEPSPALCPVTRQTRREDLLNSSLHGVGLGLAIAATALLVVFASLRGTVWHVVSFSIFGASLVVLYAVSTIYHAARGIRAKRALQVADHASIYVLIAGTYTPFTLVSLNGGWGWSLFGVVWGLAVVGIVWKFFMADRFDIVSTLVYVALGWLGLIAIRPLVENLSLGGLVWLVTGGLAYTVGAVFYLWERLPFNHAIWHLFVLAGSTCHFFAVFFHLLRLG